jgi:anti-sigma B factor antagonist
MPHDELNIDITSEENGGTLVYRLRGSLDVATSPSVRAALIAAASTHDRHIVVDLSKLEFLDSTGLGALIGAHKRAAEEEGVLRLVVGDGAISRLLHITGLMKIFPTFATVDDAVADRNRLSTQL